MAIQRTGGLGALSAEHREWLRPLAHRVSFEAGSRIFNEGGTADRFWMIRSGTVTLDMHVPGRRAAVIDTLGPGQLLGWSWLVPPRRWHLGAAARSPVEAEEFEAAAVRELCGREPELALELCTSVAAAIADRLRAARVRLLDLYAPYGAGEAPG